ncbi:hypothetical protein AGMMS50262_09590 [Bacteroidia bacterium]|nr:hypothetical protein AGMMS50262_09590 [Bacteroidia bacterium]
MKRYYFLFSAVVAGLFTTLSMNAQDTPVAGKQFRIVTDAGLYLTYDADWNADGWNLFYLDSLYTVAFDQEYTVPYTGRDPETITLKINPQKQIFTLINPDPNDPDIWAVESYDGQYLGQDVRNGWDITAVASADDANGQLFFECDNEWSLYSFKFKDLSTYIASDHNVAGLIINKYDDGWEHVDHSFLYRDKPSGQTVFLFESAVTGIKNVKSIKDLAVSVRGNALSVDKANGTLVSIYNIAGAKVIETSLQGDVNLSKLPAGVYIVATAAGERAKFIKK